MAAIHMNILMKPQPKLRARTCNGRTFTPQKTMNAEAELRFLVLESLGPIFTIIERPIELELSFYMKRPKAAKKRLHPAVRPDIDNLIKLVADGLNGVVWKDDSLIWKITATKLYTEGSERITIDVLY